MARKILKKRADLLLVEMGLAESRERAQALIMEGQVYSPAGKVLKPGAITTTDTLLEVRGRLPYVSRGGIKLAHALERFGLEVSGLVALDVGASTGGFTDCLLQHGASRVFALDVGHGQIDYRLRQDSRVLVMEGINARYPFSLPPSIPSTGDGRQGRSKATSGDEGDIHPLSNSLPPGEGELKVDLATVDVSFISATKVIPSVAQHVKDGGFIIVLVKPQFESRREEVGRGGVIKSPGVHARVLARVIGWVVKAGFRLRNLTPSPILGDAGNREFFLLLGK